MPIQELRIGRPGDLVALPIPLPNVPRTATGQQSVREALRGGITAQRTGVLRRRWQFKWERLPASDFIVLEQLRRGHRGRGGYVLVDPAAVNMLDDRASSGGDNPDGAAWTASSGTVVSSTGQAYAGLTSQLWTHPASAVSGSYVELPWAGGGFGYPVVPGDPYAFSARVSATSASFSLRADLVWFTAAGASISASSGTASAPAASLSTWGQRTATGTAPGTAAYVRPRITALAAVGSGQVAVDQAQLQWGSTVTATHPGSGVPRVALLELTDTSTLVGWHDVELTVQEVG